jgi:hypothetical protein
MEASESGMAMRPSINFHHLSVRKIPASVSNEACTFRVYHGSHSDKGHRKQAAVSEAEVCLPVRIACLASPSAFWFPEITVVFPFWYPWHHISAAQLGAHTASSNSRISCLYLTLFLPS